MRKLEDRFEYELVLRNERAREKLPPYEPPPIPKKEVHFHGGMYYSKACLKWPLLKRPKVGFQDPLSLNAGQKYCRMLQSSAILTTFIKLPFSLRSLFCLF